MQPQEEGQVMVNFRSRNGDFGMQVALSSSSRAGGNDTEDCEVCPICSEEFSTASLEFLPEGTSFVQGMPQLDTATLMDCGHKFYPLAIAFHMFVSGMNCPVCRAGRDKSCLLDISCIPSHVREEFCKKSSTMVAKEVQDDLLLMLVSDAAEMTLHDYLMCLDMIFFSSSSGNNNNMRTLGTAATSLRSGQSINLVIYLYSASSQTAPSSESPTITTLEFVLMDVGNSMFMMLHQQVSVLLHCLLVFFASFVV